MKKTIILFVLIFGLIIQANAQSEKIEVDLSQPGKPYSVDLNIIQGSIRVVKHSGKELLIEVSGIGEKSSAPEMKDGMRKINTGGRGYELVVEEKMNKVVISQNIPMKTTSITLFAPANGTFRLSTVNSGNITVEDVAGEFELSNVNGKIVLSNISGSAVVSTVNGTIQASFDNVTANKPMAFSTLNGNVDLSFPSQFKTTLKAKSDRGDVYSDFELGALKTSSNITRKTENGFSKIEASEWITGTINGGGAETMIKTLNGNIYLRKKR